MLPIDDESETKMATNEMLQELKDHLVDCMEKKRPYLNPELTLTDLAKQVDISRNQLSQVINTAAGRAFFSPYSRPGDLLAPEAFHWLPFSSHFHHHLATFPVFCQLFA